MAAMTSMTVKYVQDQEQIIIIISCLRFLSQVCRMQHLALASERSLFASGVVLSTTVSAHGADDLPGDGVCLAIVGFSCEGLHGKLPPWQNLSKVSHFVLVTGRYTLLGLGFLQHPIYKARRSQSGPPRIFDSRLAASH